MRIALISDCFAPRLGGIEAQVQDLATQLAKHGHDVTVVTATPSLTNTGTSQETLHGFQVLRLAHPLMRGVPINPFAGKALRQVIAQAEVVHIHAGIISPFAHHAALIAARSHTPTTLTWHCRLHHAYWLFRLFPFMQWVARKQVAMNTVSTVMAKEIQRLFSATQPVSVLYNGIDLADWLDIAKQRTAMDMLWSEQLTPAPVPSASAPAPTPVPSAPNSPQQTIKIVASRRLARRKRNSALIKLAVQAVRSAGMEGQVEFTIFGDGAERPKLERLIAQLNAPWVKLAGRVDRAQLRNAYRSADIYFSTALQESFGIATLEARTAGIPVVAPSNTGVDDFVTEGETGLLGANNQELVEALIRLLQDRALRLRLAKNSASTPPAQDWQNVLPATLAEYERAISLKQQAQ